MYKRDARSRLYTCWLKIEMNIEEEITTAFPEITDDTRVADKFIEENENIMEINAEIDHFKYVPAYMIWCIKNRDRKLVDMHTINALAEYGRTKLKDDNYLNFKYRCNSTQKASILSFLKWCATEIVISDEIQIERAIKQWSK